MSRGLDTHAGGHVKQPRRRMDKATRRRVFITVGILAAIVFGLYLYTVISHVRA